MTPYGEYSIMVGKNHDRVHQSLLFFFNQSNRIITDFFWNFHTSKFGFYKTKMCAKHLSFLISYNE